jgi:peptide/nickel transport system permease protein
MGAGFDRGAALARLKPDTTYMVLYVVRRLVFAVFLVFAVSSASLLLARGAAGDFITQSFGIEAHRETIDAARARYGLDKSLGAQYGDWLGRVVRFDLGRSLLYDRPVSDLIPERAANTAILAFTALLFATILGLPLGVIAGSRLGGRRVVSGAIRGASLVLLSMPPLLTSLFLIFIAARTGWLPIAGMRSPGEPATGLTLDLLRHLIVPAAALALPLAAMFERLQAQATADTIASPFVIATLSRGVPRTRVVWRDALKASLRPIAAVYGIVVGTLLSGSFVVEVITAWPGLGRLMLDALRARDIFLVAGCAGAGSIFIALGSLLSDAVLAFVDPRVAEP